MSAAARQNGVPEARIVRSNLCRAIDFFMVRDGGDYRALFTGPQLDELINPVTGYPRPEPDTATRTKGYRVPLQLQFDQPVRKQPSKFSGFMRRVVACYVARGAEIPFDYGAQVTHGIVYVDVPLDPGPGTERIYWLVECAGGHGVFATRLSAAVNEGVPDCCGSFNVEHLKPTEAEARVNPTLRIYRDTISLRWYWATRGGAVVKRILSPADLPIGGAWYVEHGWAFSASGAKAQQVTVGITTIDGAVPCLVGARYELTFTATRTVCSCAAATLESGKKYTLMIHRTVWIPTGLGMWEGHPGPGVATITQPIQKLPAQDAPVFVYFAGEVAQVVRWQLAYSEVAAVDNRPAQAFTAPDLPYPESCYAAIADATYTGPATPQSGEQTSADTQVVCGFTGPGFGNVGLNYGPRTRQAVTGIDGGGTLGTIYDNPNNNLFGFKPECFYIDSAGNLVTQAIQSQQETAWYADRWIKTDNYEESKEYKASVVLFAEEREAVMSVRLDVEGSVGSGGTSHGESYQSRERVVFVSMNPVEATPARYEWDLLQGGPGRGASAIDHSTSYDIPQTYNSSANATMSVGGVSVDYALAINSFDQSINDFNFGTFVVCRSDPEKITANSHVMAMKGNVGDANLWYYLNPAAPVMVGGFPYTTGEPIAFVGQT